MRYEVRQTQPVRKGTAHETCGQQTWWLHICLTATRTIDLSKSGCQLLKPHAGADTLAGSRGVT
jgi:hypothetical protein